MKENMFGLKAYIMIATIGAVLFGLLLLSVSYLLTPSQLNAGGLSSFITSAPPLQNQIFIAFLWLGFALLISISAVGLLALSYRISRKLKK